MALTNFILTVAGVSAVVLLMRSDVKQTATIFKRNVKQIRHWLEQESATAAEDMEKAKPKELPKDVPKGNLLLQWRWKLPVGFQPFLLFTLLSGKLFVLLRKKVA